MMQHVKHTLKHAAVLAAAALGALALVGNARGQEEIVVAYALPITGAFASVSQQEVEALQDYQSWVDGQGGIRGRKVRFVIDDTGNRVDQALAVFKKMLASDRPAVLHGDSTASIRAFGNENNERYKTFMTGNSFASELADPKKHPYYFMMGPTYSDGAGILLQYIKDSHKAGKPRVAILHSDSEFGRDPVDFIKKRAGELGIDVVQTITMKFRDVDVAQEVIKLRQAKPDYTIIHGFGGAPVFLEVMKLAREYKVPTKFMGTFYEGSRGLLKRIGEVGEGYTVVSNWAWNTSTEPGAMLKVIDGIKRKKDPSYDGYPDIFYLLGWTAAMLQHKAIEVVLDAKKPLTGDNLRQAVTELKNWDTGGVIGLPVTFRNNAIPVGRIIRFDAKATPIPVSDWMQLK
jgi:branched-chain amino acid transport system substrate-binding protein